MSGADQLYYAHCYECGWDSEPTISAWTPRGYGEELLPAMNAHYAQHHNSRGPFTFGRRPLSASNLALRTEVISPTSENTGDPLGGEPVASASAPAPREIYVRHTTKLPKKTEIVRLRDYAAPDRGLIPVRHTLCAVMRRRGEEGFGPARPLRPAKQMDWRRLQAAEQKRARKANARKLHAAPAA